MCNVSRTVFGGIKVFSSRVRLGGRLTDGSVWLLTFELEELDLDVLLFFSPCDYWPQARMRPDRPRLTSWQLHTSVFVSFFNSRPSSPSTDSTFISLADTLADFGRRYSSDTPAKQGRPTGFSLCRAAVSVHSAEVSNYNSCLPSSDISVIALQTNIWDGGRGLPKTTAARAKI